MGPSETRAEPSGPILGRRETAGLVAWIAATSLLRLWATPAFPESIDGLHFVAGVEQYSVAALHPHWPGYPVFIAAGKLLRPLSGGPVQALHAVSALASSLAAWPLGLLTAAWRRSLGGSRSEARRAGLAAAVLWSVTPASWTTGTEIWSDPLGLLVALLLLGSTMKALEPGASSGWLLMAGAWGGLLPGIRLSYALFLVPLAYATWLRRREALVVGGVGRGPLPLGVAASGGVVVATWLGAQLAAEGWDLILLGQGHVVGHFTSWGGSVATDRLPLWRPYRLAERVAEGLVGERPWGGPSWGAALGLLALMGLGVTKARSAPAPDRLPLYWGGAYLAWVLLAHEVDLPRYALPLVSLACAAAALGLPRAGRSALLVVAVLGLLLLSVTVPSALRHRSLVPVGFRVGRYLAKCTDPASTTLILSPEAGYLTEFLAAGMPPRVDLSLSAGDASLPEHIAEAEAAGRTVLATAVPASPRDAWVPVARFCGASFRVLEGFGEIWLFRHGPGAEVPTIPPCDQAPPKGVYVDYRY